ncbi:MAG: hypothetical protein IMF18_05975 [Proteobacteria bacterium]|nr:hypothetical protein [Pseudomonadota bacterium]
MNKTGQVVKPNVHIINSDHPHYPGRLAERLGDEALQTLWAVGPLDLLGGLTRIERARGFVEAATLS